MPSGTFLEQARKLQDRYGQVPVCSASSGAAQLGLGDARQAFDGETAPSRALCMVLSLRSSCMVCSHAMADAV